MRKYEMMFIVRPELEEEAIQKVSDKFKSIIENDGQITNEKIMGKRRLAYEINKLNDGFYILWNFESTTDTVKELNRVIRITDEVVRHMVISDVA